MCVSKRKKRKQRKKRKIFKTESIKSICSGSCFPAFGLNTERYSVSLCIQSKCGKTWTRITPNTDNFYGVLGQNVTVLAIPEDLESKHISCWPTMVPGNTC